MIEHQIIELVQTHGILAVVLGAFVEEIIVPIPSPIIPMAAGAFLIEPQASITQASITAFFIITIPGAVASVVSSYFVYSIAYFGGEASIKRFGKFLDLEWKEVQAMEEYFGTEKEKYLVAGFRAIPIIPLSLVSGAAGLFKMDWKEYGIWSLMGMIPRYFFLALLGWYFRDGITQVAGRISKASQLVAFSVVFIVAAFLIYRKSKDLYRQVLIE